MPRILKSVNFESEQAVPIDTGRMQSDAEPMPGEESLGAGPDDDSLVQSMSPEEAAEHRIQIMLDEANAKIEAWREEARRTGWRAGYDESRQAVENELGEALRRARNLAESAAGERQAYLRDNQQEISRLAVAIAEKIIGRELALEPETVGDIVAQVIEAADVREACSIRVHPDDYKVLLPHWEAAAKVQQPDRKWELVSDKRIDRGGCVIEVAGGTVDGQLKTQLGEMGKALGGVGR
jgi:flagellar assembly protein FliH